MWEGGLGLGFHTMSLLYIVAILLVTPFMATSFNASLPITRYPNCTSMCGNVSIPYPFGIEDGCYYVEPVGRSYYNLSCDRNTTPPTLIYGSSLVVVNITLDGDIRILNYPSYDCYDYSIGKKYYYPYWINSWKFTISTSKNNLVAIGCDTYVWFNGTSTKYTSELQSGCSTLCSKEQVNISNDACSGIGCCKAFLPNGMNSINISAESYNNHSTVRDFNPCSVAFVVANDAMPPYGNLLSQNVAFLNLSYPVVYTWSVGTKGCEAAQADNGYLCHGNSTCIDMDDQAGYGCKCNPGFQGYPYVDDCQDVDECAEEVLNICEKQALCFNTIGSYYCSCPQGFYGNGTKNDPCIPNYHRRYKWLIGSSTKEQLGMRLLCDAFYERNCITI